MGKNEDKLGRKLITDREAIESGRGEGGGGKMGNEKKGQGQIVWEKEVLKG